MADTLNASLLPFPADLVALEFSLNFHPRHARTYRVQLLVGYESDAFGASHASRESREDRKRDRPAAFPKNISVRIALQFSSYAYSYHGGAYRHL